MNITLNFPLDRRDFLDQDGLTPDESVSDAELLLMLAESDYKQFSQDIAKAVVKTLNQSISFKGL